jgi:tripartite-type tricarboxylate transporter receptor subunit TctC
MKKLLAAFAGLACLVGAVAGPGVAAAQDYPNRAITIIVPFPAGSVPDVMTRLVADHMKNTLGQAIVVDNRPGAGGNIGTAAGARAEPDGYTVTFIGSPAVLAMHTMKAPGYDLFADFLPVGRMNTLLNVIAVNSKLQIKSVRELIAYAKANPGRLNYASSGPATPTDLGGRHFANVHGLDYPIIAYKGSSATAQALASGEADFSILPAGVALPQIQSGAVRALALGTQVKWELLPDVPGADEAGAKVKVDGWTGFAVPKGTPQPVIQKLNAALNQALAQDNVKRGATQTGGIVLPGTPDDLTNLMKQDFENVREMVASAKLEKN